MVPSTDNPVLPAQVRRDHAQFAIPSLPHWIEPTIDYLRQRAILSGACQESRAGKLMIALHEAVTNAVIHGNLEISSVLKEQGDSAFAQVLAQRASDPALAGRLVDIVIEYDGDACRWIITDQGNGFDIEAVLARCLSDDPEILLASGRGILMMKSFLDDVRFDLGGKRVTLTLFRRSGDERRTDPRVSMIAPFKVTPIGPGGAPDWDATYEAVSRNLSADGISLLQRQLHESGKILISIPTETGVMQFPAEVKHSRTLSGGGMEIGCQFSRTTPPTSAPAEVASVVSPQVEAVYSAVARFLEGYQTREVPGNERRQHTRVVFNERVRIILDGRPDAFGYSRDLSRSGMAMITQTQLPREVTIEIEQNSHPTGLKFRCQVMRCQRIMDGFYDVGVAFRRLDTTTTNES